MKPFTHRQPAKGRHRPFAWGRKLEQSGAIVAYVLFRRDHSGRVHSLPLQYLIGVAPRPVIAGDLLKAKRRLRDRVDEINLAAMERAALKAAISALSGEATSMRGKMIEADFEADTVTFAMESGYLAGAGEYVITPVVPGPQAAQGVGRG